VAAAPGLIVTTAFVLTGGGSLGAVQVGMLAALVEQGIRPDVLVGTSVGAVNAAYLAGAEVADEPGLQARLQSLTRLWHDLHRHDVFALEPRRWWGAARGGHPSLFSDTGLSRLLQRHLGYKALEDAGIPVEVTVTDLVTGVGRVLDAGPAAEAVRASAAVPGILPPVVVGGSTHVDGAIGELDVLGHTAAHDVTDIYLLPAGYPCAGTPPVSALGITLTSLSLLLHRGLIAQVRSYAGAARLHVVPPLCPLSVSPADFTHTSALIGRAHLSTRDWLRTSPRSIGPVDDASVLALHSHRQRTRHRGDNTAQERDAQEGVLS
jgi:NTE family protein